MNLPTRHTVFVMNMVLVMDMVLMVIMIIAVLGGITIVWDIPTVRPTDPPGDLGVCQRVRDIATVRLQRRLKRERHLGYSACHNIWFMLGLRMAVLYYTKVV